MVSRFRFGLAAALGLIWAGGAAAAPPLTTVQDVLYKADGTRFNGTLTIRWNSFQASDSSAIVTQSTTVKVQDGLLRVQLVPTTTSTPPTVYTVTYNADGRVQFQESWSVPSSAQPLHVRDVRTTAAPASSSAGADTGGITESSVTGLIADLGARPVKSPTYTPGRAAVVDSTGLISTAAGNGADCMHVDGSSAPCGGVAAAFVDSESPAGIVDGSNTVFAISATPDPAGSLAVYRNGMLQKAGQDYTVTGATLTFASGATPQPGDTLLASYRLNGTGGSSGASSSYPTPQILCAGTGQSTSAATLSVLATCNIPAGLLAPGDDIEIRFDYAHQGAGTVSIEVDWGATTLVHRDAPAGETLITGRGSAAILAGGAQLSAQSWGTSASFAAALGGAADNYSAGLAVTFSGNVAQSGDTLTLNSFTLVRVP